MFFTMKVSDPPYGSSSSRGTEQWQNVRVWDSLQRDNQNNETLDFVHKDIFVENIVHICVDIVDVN